MKVLAKLSLSQKIILIVATSLVVTAVTLSAVFLRAKHVHLMDEAQGHLRDALVLLATELPDHTAALQPGAARPGALTSLVRTPGPLSISTEFVDRISRALHAHVTVFDRNPATGEFERVMTSVQRPDGTRAVGTILDPNGPAKAALARGETYTGPADILGQPYLTLYEPVFDREGRVAGAVFSGVRAADVNAALIDFLLPILGPVLAIIAVAIAAGYALIRVQMRPLGRLATAIGGLAAGDYRTEIPPAASQDDIGALTQACITLRDSLRRAAEIAEEAADKEMERERDRAAMARVVDDLRDGLARLAEGDLTRPIESPASNPFPAAYDPLRQSFNAVLDRINDVLQHVNELARSVRESATEIASASRDLSGRAETQAATLEESAAALTELTESVRSTASLAARAQEASAENRAVAERGSTEVRDAVKAMQDIERGSEQITRIIGVIEDIAFQTNLLALNAGVEAARAGDAGRGFAVVASEVRLLAQRAAESAREIKALIADSTQQVAQGSGLVRRTGTSLAEILDRANTAASLVAEIAHAAAEQARGLAEVNTGVNQLDSVTQQNSAAAEETSAAAAALQARSEELMVALSGFRTRATAVTRPATAAPSPNMPGAPVIEPKVVDWSSAAAQSSRTARTRQTGTWADF